MDECVDNEDWVSTPYYIDILEILDVHYYVLSSITRNGAASAPCAACLVPRKEFQVCLALLVNTRMMNDSLPTQHRCLSVAGSRYRPVVEGDGINFDSEMVSKSPKVLSSLLYGNRGQTSPVLPVEQYTNS